MENLTIAEIENLTLPRYAGGKVMSGKNSFELYVNFLWIFACIYVLSKLTQLLERVLAQRLLGQKQWCDVRSIENEWQLTLQLYEEDKRQLEAQVRELREKNLIMERMMVELRDCNIHLISANFMRSVMQDQISRPPQPNIYVSNTHFHLTRQVIVNERHIDLNVHNAGGKVTDSMGSMGEDLNVWLHYLKMRKCYIGPIADPNLTAPRSSEHMLPIVMSTEQLANLQGKKKFI